MSSFDTRIALIADTHFGAVKEGRGRKCSEYAAQYLKNFSQQLKNADFAVQLGDLIQDAGPEHARRNLLTALSILDQNETPLYHLIGNHDSRHIPPMELRQLFGLEKLSYHLDHGGFRFIFLHNTVVDLVSHSACVSRKDLQWLKGALITPLPCIVFTHYPLADQDLTDNVWFKDRPNSCLLSNRREVRQTLEDSRRVLAAINGHAHWNNITIHKGIPYLSIQSAVEGIGQDFLPANARGELLLGENELCLKVFGRDPMLFSKRFLRDSLVFDFHTPV
jgi:calcineurin-like phosphoesterase family protein